MSIDYYTCSTKNCGNTFADCGDYISCNCQAHWCSDKCAEKDGYKVIDCEKFDEYPPSDEQWEQICSNCDKSCDCENGELKTCNFCRGEDIPDNEIVDKIIKKKFTTRQKLLNYLNKESLLYKLKKSLLIYLCYLRRKFINDNY